MSKHLRDYQHGDYELSVYWQSDANNYSVDIKTPVGEVIGAFGELQSEAIALQIGKAFCGGYTEGASRAPAPAKVLPLPVSRRGTVSVSALLADAGSLLSDGDGDNPEYDRALVEMTGRVLGIPLDTDEARYAVLTMLRAVG